MLKRIGLYCFTQDLRIEDNLQLQRALSECDSLLFVYIHASQTQFHQHFSPHQWEGEHKRAFRQQSLQHLKASVGECGHVLHQFVGQRSRIITQLLSLNEAITDVYLCTGADWDLLCLKEYVESRHSNIAVHSVCSNALFNQSDLPFEIEQLPNSFSSFRKKVEKIPILQPLKQQTLNDVEPYVCNVQGIEPFSDSNENMSLMFSGGESSGADHIKAYFETNKASIYKETRNHFDEWQHSTVFSLWLAWGCITPRQIVSALKQYEHENEQNDSTYWILFELLWREYFRLYAEKHGAKLFAFDGIQQKRPLTTFYAEQYRAWCAGRTGYDVVDACMRQLNQTGMMSNRGRQLVASCFVHELGLDWRYGAAYFEAMLIDYDVSSNWGNWQYLAGVGADPRGHRKFDLEKQIQWYDPNREFIQRWVEA
ncbi:DASH family cryptochrome [Vibrio astriarenae]